MMSRDDAGPDRDATQPTVPQGPSTSCLMGDAPAHAKADGLVAGAVPTAFVEPAPASVTKVTGGRDSLAETLGVRAPVLLQETEGADEADPPPRLTSSAVPDLAQRSSRLQLFDEIARGGMGAVLRGRDMDLGRDLAVKVLLEKHSGSPDLVRRFLDEAQIAGQLQHPGVVPVYEMGVLADRRPYFAMKLIKGALWPISWPLVGHRATIGRASSGSSSRWPRRSPMRTAVG